MTKNFPKLALAGLGTVAMIIAACAETSRAGASAQTDIVETAQAAGQFQTLVAAIGAAGLAETLKGPGPFTVFAPTDDAFAKLPEGTVESLLKPENRDKLTAILTYHVAPGQLMAADVVGSTRLATVNGASIPVEAVSGAVRVGDAQVVAADVVASNGVIHVIDTVLLPPAN